ncbi:hypothetical protein R1flu_003785 [Riccia fluitans]|uniref:Uncharacterized protein n=1 Tax=Riccia fluitans TaxID=41844 RepID=A0ABD1YA39_9MARC
MRVITKVRAKGFLPDPLQHEALTIFQHWLSSVRVGPQRLEDSPSWSLKGLDKKWNGWLLPSKTWHKLLMIDEEPDDLTSKWRLGVYRLTWSDRWKKLWGAGGLMRTKTWLWKLLHYAFFTVTQESCGANSKKEQGEQELASE